ncbi:hypothetical protein [Neomegalonema perideroedes]|uniref:hypothetical protein n=1 Tax=Neomegalonema perideroedes TaxID=217219 RepID=UPI0003611699|nr:hypothetical protein [Neomegalonema perideroedes]
MKKLLIAASLAALSTSAFAAEDKNGSLNVELEAYVEYSCGFGDVGAAAAYDIERAAKFDLTQATSGEIQATPTVGPTHWSNGAQAPSASFRAFCNSVKGAELKYEGAPLARRGVAAADLTPQDLIPVRGAFYYRAQTAPFAHGYAHHTIGYNQAEATHNINQAFDTSVAGSFHVEAVKTSSGAYTKHAGFYDSVYKATLTALE